MTVNADAEQASASMNGGVPMARRPSSTSTSAVASTSSAPTSPAVGKTMESGTGTPGEDANESEEEDDEEDGDDDDSWPELASVSSKIVGVQNHMLRGFGQLKTGQDVELRRDPLGLRPSGITIRHLGKGAQIGELDYSMAKKLAPLLDMGDIAIEGKAAQVPFNKIGVYTVPLNIAIYGPKRLRKDRRLNFAFPERARKEREAQAKLAQAAARDAAEKEAQREDDVTINGVIDQLNGNKANTAKIEAIVGGAQAPRPATDILAQLFKEGGQDPATLPPHPCPPGRLDKTMRTDLMRFQSQGLAWMIRMEHPEPPKEPGDHPVQLWVRNGTGDSSFYLNLATRKSQKEPPAFKRGGILADEMGLGKTLQTIALICTDDTGEGVLSQAEEPDERFDDMTLIVCPLSVVGNWTDQLERHVGSKRLRWHVYHNDGRGLSKKQLRKYDVVITTYQTLAIERVQDEEGPPTKKAKTSATSAKPKEDGPLFHLRWRRVVFDEGHVVKNPKAKMSRACAALKAERRWVLTGTPIVNSTADLGAMIGLLRICKPLDERPVWNTLVETQIKKDDNMGAARLLRAVVQSSTLRRTKDMRDAQGAALVNLPSITFYIHKVDLHPQQREIYSFVWKRLSSRFNDFMRHGTASSHYSHILVYLLRLRQLACDPILCPPSFIDDVRADALAMRESEDPAQLDPAEVTRLQTLLQQMEAEDCLACTDVPINPRITYCGHVFCEACIEEMIECHGVCPVDRKPLTKAQLVEPAAPDDMSQQDSEMEVLELQQRQVGEMKDAAKLSNKITELIRLLQAMDKDAKSLVFSQWTSHLNLIQVALDFAGISTCRFDGSMTHATRESVVKAFHKPNSKANSPRVMLISLKAGALGLNLTCASQVFLMDPWWQASIEQQAIDRVYRLGQTRPVNVFQLVARDTVEERVLGIQEAKNRLISQAFSGSKTAFKEREKIDTRMQDIAQLFGAH